MEMSDSMFEVRYRYITWMFLMMIMLAPQSSATQTDSTYKSIDSLFNPSNSIRSMLVKFRQHHKLSKSELDSLVDLFRIQQQNVCGENSFRSKPGDDDLSISMLNQCVSLARKDVKYLHFLVCLNAFRWNDAELGEMVGDAATKALINNPSGAINIWYSLGDELRRSLLSCLNIDRDESWSSAEISRAKELRNRLKGLNRQLSKEKTK
jgi:hypothetical protein